VSAADGNDTSVDFDAPSEFRSLAFGIRFLAASLTVALGVFNIGVCSYLPTFNQIFKTALPGQILPPLTTFIIGFRFEWMIVAVLLPIIAVISAAVVRGLRAALISVSLVAVAISVQDTLTWTNLIPPMIMPLGEPHTSAAQ